MNTLENALRTPTREEIRRCADMVRRRIEVRPIDEIWHRYFGAAELARAMVKEGLNPVGVKIYLPLLAQVIGMGDNTGRPLLAGEYTIGIPTIHHNSQWDEIIPVHRSGRPTYDEQLINGRCTIFTLTPWVKWNDPTEVRANLQRKI